MTDRFHCAAGRGLPSSTKSIEEPVSALVSISAHRPRWRAAKELHWQIQLLGPQSPRNSLAVGDHLTFRSPYEVEKSGLSTSSRDYERMFDFVLQFQIDDLLVADTIIWSDCRGFCGRGGASVASVRLLRAIAAKSRRGGPITGRNGADLASRSAGHLPKCCNSVLSSSSRMAARAIENGLVNCVKHSRREPPVELDRGLVL